MAADYTPAIQRALEAAADWASRLNRPQPDALTLLLGLLDESEGHAAALLIRGGLAGPAVRSHLAELPNPPESAPIDSVLVYAAGLARELSGELEPRTGHLLLAILRTDGPLHNELQRIGLDLAAIESAFSATAAPTLTLDEPLDLSDTTDALDTARILDASANRAREALRVIEDYCRFALNDAFLSREVKSLRHDLTEALSAVQTLPLLEARDTLGDVGTDISTPAEWRRDSALDVARTNLKRLQEALRSLEEFGKVAHPALGPALEKMRYRSYTLERALVLGQNSRERLAGARLYLLVTGSACATSLDFLIAEAAAGGVDVVQLREKELSDRALLSRARKVRQWTRAAGVLFIVNDRPDIARLAEADGVHLGQDDLPVREARRIVGADALIGVSTHSLDQLHQAIRDGASYVGIGPVFASATKSFAEFPGLEYVRQATSETTLPAFALGGVTATNLPQVLAAGAKRIAVSSAICSADEPREAARALRETLDPAAANPYPA